MKIVCDACGAKYAIADEKVRGKVFKIRCKKCSNVIVVRGMSGEGDAADEQLSQQETRTFGYDEQESAEPASSEGVWHLVIDQDQIGPVTDDEVRARFARGEIDRDTYAWREGFGDWMPLGSIDVFTDLGQAGSGRVAAPPAASAEAPAADPFAAAGGDAGGDLFGGASAADGLFGGNGGGGDRRLRGERNENSVLFSLGNLAALASDAPKAAAAPSGGMGAAPAGRAQAGGSEGSGLIDIRSMAQSYLGAKDRAEAANPLSSFSAIEPVTFPTQSPVLLPQAPVAGGGSNKTLIAAIIGGSAAVIVAVVVVLIIVLRGGDGPTVAEDTGTGATGTTPPGEPATPDTPPDTDKPDTTGEGAGGTQTAAQKSGTPETPPPSNTPAADIAGKKPENDRDDDDRRRPSGRDRDTGSKPRDNDKPDKPDDKPAPSPPSGGGGCLDEVGCLLADKPPACCSKYSGGGSGGGSRKPGGGGGGGGANLPEKLTRSDITAGINKVRSSVSSCRSKGSGEVKVTVKVQGSGSVGNVNVKSAPNAALGSCVANAVKKAKFAKTQEGATFTYPFVF